jgi:hypothetical protein
MARKATRDTYGVEMVGGVEVRRLVKAGDPVPDTYTVPDGDVEGGSGAATASIDPTAGPSGGDEELSGEELDARAAELDIKGRSSMTADEKREAIAEAEANQ